MADRMISDERRAIISLHLVPEIGPFRARNLLLHFGSAREALAAPLEEIASVEGWNAPLAKKALKAGYRSDVEHEIEAAARLGIKLLTCADPEYPEALKPLDDLPPVLYVRGDLPPAAVPAVAVVGTRYPTPYGISMAERFGYELGMAGFTVVSGLARGIDTAVHGAVLSAGAKTVAVLGNGLKHHYPRENKALEDRIAAQGALISEFPLDRSPDPMNFPRRNRIISGLCAAVVVIEADIKSGALITARAAAEQGKDVFAVPGPAVSKMSRGPHYLIKSGARLAECAEDIINEIKPLFEGYESFAQGGTDKKAGDMECHDPVENDIMAVLGQEPGGVSIDALASRLPFSSGDLARALLMMEMRGLIRGLPGKMYVKK